MDPATAAVLLAWAKAVEATATMITEIHRGQPPEVRAQAWQWWLEDQARWRKWLKLDA